MPFHLCVGLDLVLTNRPTFRWHRLLQHARLRGANAIGGMLEFQSADPDELSFWLEDHLEPGDAYAIRVVLPDAFDTKPQRID